ncbi:hypothetical protein LXG23DRAFT_48665 [Yarrowia lipolytica]|jgi:hypothetical protein|uniref:Uncharacterized protein n=1 Tax=Yarrowia lipolytica TaxID=4952 RepID=A0A1H6PXU4_YARLL|nr:hypothetical protein YALI1_D18373g [Yarrowia lipolytica]KAB8285105.1 hypothetical protein BKA91DRAFT_166003 [Yarrowia lipolytica]KAE8170879.1 hypothetical protein BKA90DRAFT_175493 [Yarrowia lipolytica]KAJ8054369.1 hypothetical protein LXG23DRAFT_48665 [Yarrowia lipolytica]RMI97364.1 hypothetical protein BD777DRAFT_115075 [Yarrowia lipolytica]
MSSATSIHFDTVTSGVTTITQPTVALAHPLRTVYDYYAQPREKALSLEDSSDSRDAHSFTSSSYASISTVSSFHVTLRDAKLKHVTRFKQWTKRVKEKVLTKFNPPIHPSTTLSCVHSLVESMDVPLTDTTTGQLTHWPVLLKLVDHMTHNFPFTQNQLWCVQRTISQLDSLVFGAENVESVVLDMEETETRLLGLVYKFKTVFCLNYRRDMSI